MTTLSPSHRPSIPVLIENAIKRRIPRGWDENHITFSWLEDLFEHYGNTEMQWGGGKLLLDCQKLTGHHEQSFGDVGFLVKFSSYEGKSFIGFGSMEAKRSYPDKPYNKYAKLDPAQLEYQAAFSACHRLLLYSHTEISITKEILTHAVVIPAQIAVLCSGNTADLEGAGVRLSGQVLRYLRGWDLDFSPQTIDAVLSGEHLFGQLLRAHVAMTPEVSLHLEDLQIHGSTYVSIDSPDQDMRYGGPSQSPPPPPTQRPSDRGMGGFSL